MEYIDGPLVSNVSDQFSLQWRDERVAVKLPSAPSNSIKTITIHKCLMSHKFIFPSSFRLLSPCVYELSRTLKQESNLPSTDYAEITLPYHAYNVESSVKMSFFQASRIPNWRSDLTPMYMFHVIENNSIFDANLSLASIKLQKFDCFICVGKS